MTPHPEHSAAVDLAPDADRALAEFLEHLRLERGRSPHTVRAYRADLTGLLAGLRALPGLDLGAAARVAGRRARRRSGAVHARPQGRRRAHVHGMGAPEGTASRRSRRPAGRPAAPIRPADRARPRAGRRGARRDRLTGRARRPGGDPGPARRRAALRHRDAGRRALRARPGRRRRAAPRRAGGRQGRPGADRGLRRPRRSSPAGVARRRVALPWPDPGRRPRCCSVRAEAASTRGSPVGWCTGPWRPSRTSPTSARTAFGTRRRRTCSTAARTFVTYRSCSVTLSYRRLSSTRMSPSSG